MNYVQQANDFCAKNNIAIKCEKPVMKRHFDGDKEERCVWQVTIHRTTKGQKMTVEFGNSINNKMKMPTNYDILTCLTKYDPGTFNDFCLDYGYSNDSIQHRRIYFAVQKEWEDVRRVFAGLLDELSEIQ